jgi:4-amino-4-deoxy-L-arabinose transferase-like glycosyltransferase
MDQKSILAEEIIKNQMNRDKLAITIPFVFFASCLLFANLGKYALWDDESYTALAAKVILATGDTTSVLFQKSVL